jgi:hypothetical protein
LHRFQQRQPESLVERGENQQLGAGQKVGLFLAAHIAQADNPRAGVESADGLVVCLNPPPVGSDHGQLEIVVMRPHPGHGLDQADVILAGLDGPDDHNIGPAYTFPALFRIAGRHRIDTVVDHVDPVGRNADIGHHLVRHRLGHAVNVGTSLQRPVDQNRISGAVAVDHFRVAPGR